MKNGIVLIFVFLALIAALWLLNRDEQELPHIKLKPDTTEVIVNKSQGETGGSYQLMGSADPTSTRTEEKAEFMGKAYSNCMALVYRLPNSSINKIENNVEGVSYIDFNYKKIHHILYFDKGICISDEVQKNK